MVQDLLFAEPLAGAYLTDVVTLNLLSIEDSLSTDYESY